MDSGSVRLATGLLEYEGLSTQGLSLNDLCGFGARNNARRGFVFVSRVLGKHLPCPAVRMTAAQALLAGEIAPDAGSTIFVGMAETATGLGHGVFEAHLRARPSPSAYFQTTRYLLSGARAIEFEEEHSHATRQFLYAPETDELRRLVRAARNLVLIDDEASTGTTFANLVRALRPEMPDLATVTGLVLTDFSDGAAQCALQRAAPGLRASVAALWQGRYRFEPSRRPLPPGLPAQAGTLQCQRQGSSAYTARLGTTTPVPAFDPHELRALVAPGQSVLVVGTGECMHAACVLASAFDAIGARGSVQSTTRSPLLVGHDVRSALMVDDPYGEGVANYLYNFQAGDFDACLVVHEGTDMMAAQRLASRLGAHRIGLMGEPVRQSCPE